MTKNNKNPKSFWKKWIGKNRTSISSLKSEPNLLYDSKKEYPVENKRSSGLFFYQMPPPSPKPTQESAPPPPPPPKEKIHVNKVIEQQEEKDTSTTTIIFTEQPNVTPSHYSNTSNKQKDNESISSFIVIKHDEEIAELQSTIENLRSELESEKATNLALQKQKQAVAKDLDYFEITIDEMLAEKNDLSRQLEDEKIKSQQHLDELDIVLQKMKANADTAARELAQAKSEIRDLQDTMTREHEAHLLELSEKEKMIRELKSKLNKSQEQADSLRGTLDHLIKTHAEDTVAKKEPETRPKPELKEPVVEVRKKTSNIPLPQSMKKPSSELFRIVAPPKEESNLDDQLLKLIKEKEKLQSSYSKLPLNGGGPKLRRRKDELESMLDQVDSQLSKVRQKIKKS